MDARFLQVDIAKLLEDSPWAPVEVKTDVRDFLVAGELALAFDTLCSWIYENDLEIDRDYYSRLVELADAMDATRIVGKLSELVREGN